MDLPMTNNAIEFAEFPEHVNDKIFIIQRKPFEVF